MKKLLILLLILTSSVIFAQRKWVGFYCGYAGNPSAQVVMMDSLVKKSEFMKIRKKLFDTDNATKCLAVIVCEILEKKGSIILTKHEKNEIIKAYKSEGKITIIFGCASLVKTTMKKILNENDNCNESGEHFKRIAIKRYKKF